MCRRLTGNTRSKLFEWQIESIMADASCAASGTPASCAKIIYLGSKIFAKN